MNARQGSSVHLQNGRQRRWHRAQGILVRAIVGMTARMTARVAASAMWVALMACGSRTAPQAPLSGGRPAQKCSLAKHVIATPKGPLAQGLRLWLGDGVTPDPGAARRALQQACEEVADAGEEAPPYGGAACAILGMMFTTGQAGPKDIAHGQELLWRSGDTDFDLGGCEIGQPTWGEGITDGDSGCDRIGIECEEGCEALCEEALHRVRAETVDALERGCDRGSALACYVVAVQLSFSSYFQGLGYVVQGGDVSRAQRLFERACEGGLGAACESRGSYLQYDLDGRHPPDWPQALTLFQKACDLGDGYGCQKLAKAFEQGKDAALLHGRATALFERACDLGMHAVCADLGQMYEVGNGVPKDPAKARRFAAQARMPWTEKPRGK
jgi:TPR repeat protein